MSGEWWHYDDSHDSHVRITEEFCIYRVRVFGCSINDGMTSATEVAYVDFECLFFGCDISFGPNHANSCIIVAWTLLLGTNMHLRSSKHQLITQFHRISQVSEYNEQFLQQVMQQKFD